MPNEKTQSTQKNVIKRMFDGVVVKKSGSQTIRVKVGLMMVHPKYKKRYMTHKNYLVHDPKNQYAEGDKVKFQQCRPISKMKRWRVIY